MISLFKPARTSYIGVDISGSHVKMLELTGTPEKMRVENYVIEAVPEGAFSDNLVLNPEQLGECLRRCWSKLNTKTKSLALAVSSSHISSKKIQVPTGLDERDISEHVETAVANFVPVSRADLLVDFQITDTYPDTGFDEVFVAVTKRQNVELLLQSTDAAMLNARILDIESNPIMHALNEMLPDMNVVDNSNIMVVDIGSDHSNFLVYRNGELVHSSEVSTHGSGLAETIKSAYGISDQQALQLMVAPENFTSAYPNYVSDILQPFYDAQAMEVAKRIKLFEHDVSGEWGTINKIVLAGGIASLDGLDESISLRTGVETYVANPMAHCALSSKIDPVKLLNDAPRLMACFGLALRSFV